MPMEIKLQGIKEKDSARIKKLDGARKSIIADSSSKPILTNYHANELATILHPKVQHVVIKEIIEESEDTKTYVLAPNEKSSTKRLAPFCPGQYITLTIKIGTGIYKRPYTLCCSPKFTLENNLYKLTIKKIETGIVSSCLFNHAQVGDYLDMSAPTGEFVYSSLRDEKNVIAIAEGRGITPFLAMAEAIKDNILDFHLTLVYIGQQEQDFLFKERLEELKVSSKNIQVDFILIKEKNEWNQEIFAKYKNEDTSYFLSGSLEFYSTMNEILKEWDLEKKLVRHDLFKSEIDLDRKTEYNITVKTQNEEIQIVGNSEEAIMTTLERNGIVIPSKCHVGECGYCRSKLLEGQVKTFVHPSKLGDRSLNYIHPCSSYPESDIVLQLPN